LDYLAQSWIRKSYILFGIDSVSISIEIENEHEFRLLIDNIFDSNDILQKRKEIIAKILENRRT